MFPGYNTGGWPRARSVLTGLWPLSIHIPHTAGHKISQVSQLDTKLRDLDEERSELAAFQSADRTRRSLDYALLQLEMADVRDAQAALSEETAEHAERAGAARDSVRDAEARAGTVSSTLRALSTRRRELEARRAESAAERVSLLQRQAALELDVQDLERGISGASDSRAMAREELLRVRAAVEARRAELATRQNALSTAEREEIAAEAALAARDARRQALVAKNGRGGQFANVAERDAALNAEIRQARKRRYMCPLYRINGLLYVILFSALPQQRNGGRGSHQARDGGGGVARGDSRGR